jgi:flavin-dependent dehydrogenase
VAETADVAIIGGGLAGTSLAIRLARTGSSVVLIERASVPRWRACGVFSSPLTRRHLADLGLPPATISELYRPISALNLQTTSGVSCRVEYERGFACGCDRPRLDAELFDLAKAAGVDVRMGTDVRRLDLENGRGARLSLGQTVGGTGGETQVRARVAVGAAGSGSILRSERGPLVTQSTRIRKSGLTFHRLDPRAAPEGEAMEGRFVFGHLWYVGIAPVPRGRVNVGMVLPPQWLRTGAASAAERLIGRFPAPRDEWMDAPNTDEYQARGVLNHRPNRLAGDGWLLVGDATGFIDPLTGEGIHRAFVSSELAAESIAGHLRGDRNAPADYDRRLRARFGSKDVVSWVLQGFLAQPRAFDYALARLARRHGLRREFTLVLTDQLPATRVLDPRFLARLLAP